MVFLFLDVTFPFLAGEFGAVGAGFFAAQLGESGDELSDSIGALGCIGGLLKVAKDLGEFGHEDDGELAVQVGGSGAVGNFFGLFLHLANGGEALLLGEPVQIAAFFPFGEVLFTDGVAVEFVLDEMLDFGEGIEPADEGGAFLAIFQALVELVADGFGEASDFAGASHKIVKELVS